MSTLEVKAIQAPTGYDLQMPAGHIIQTVSATKTDIFSTSSTSAFVDVTGLTASITPSSASNKIYVTVSGRFGNTVNGYWVKCQLLRGSTVITHAGGNQNGQASFNGTTCNMTILDSPSTTSSVTYKVQMRVEGNVGRWNSDGTPNSDGSDSTITLMEVAG